jgi:hypothetical protein
VHTTPNDTSQLPALSCIASSAGRYDEARAIVARFLKEKPGFTLANEAPFTLAQKSLKRGYLDDLRKAVLPEA